MKVAIIDYGAGNIKSIQFAFKRLGIEAILTNDIEVITVAERVVFPGVGDAKHAMNMLRKSKLDYVIPNLKQPVLGICLGMQLLCNHTEEGDTKGLGLFNVKVKRFSNVVKVPQIGWNNIVNLKSNLFDGLSENECLYLIHSYYAELCDHTIATTNYNGNYSSALQNNNFYGVQFHPEKSSQIGEKILKNFLEL